MSRGGSDRGHSMNRAGSHLDDARTRAIGLELFARVKKDAGSFFRADRWTSALFEWALREEAAKLQLFRFVDVLPALGSDREVARHLREYFEGRPAPFAALVKVGLAVARAGWPGEKLTAAVLRHTVEHLARRFIAGSTPQGAIAAALEARGRGQVFTVDVLGEACVSEGEADVYQRRYLALIERFGEEAPRWRSDPRLDRAAWGELPRVNISVKLSALYPYLDPIDPRTSIEAVRARLLPILEAAQRRGTHIQIDMEEHRLKDLTLDIFMALAEEPEFRGTRNLGVVLQAYLETADADAQRLVQWARRRGTPITVRLVKGAYWDFETAHAELEGWPVPVYQVKRETDASFERLARLFLEHADVVDLAVGSHNIRSIAHALAVRERLGLPQNQIEFQMLYGMAAPLARALAERGERVRIYMPFGELIPGMAYLVRRLLENTSNESFLRQGFAVGESPEVLLADPARIETSRVRDRSETPGVRGPLDSAETPGVRGRRDGPETKAAEPHQDHLIATVPPFVNEPHADFSREAERRKLAAALAAVRSRFGGNNPLRIDGRPVETAAHLVSRNPSRPQEIVGRTASATSADIDHAVAAALRAFPAWERLGAAERGRRLAAAADLMRERRAELAAWIVYEAGKPWREADADVAESIDFIEYYRRHALELQAPRRLGERRGEVNHYIREPRGVVGVIAPWNFPLAIVTGMTSAALATGNTVVLKPAEQTPVIAARLVSLLEEAGVPPGVVNYTPGPGETAGDRLVNHPDVRLIAFTGSRDVGTAIYAAAARTPEGARHVKRVIAEMGGKNAVIVDDDADLDETVQGVIASAFGYAGQKCSACARVIGVGRIYERLIERLVEAARTLPLGPADDPGTVVGPIIDAASLDRIQSYIELGKRLARPALIRDLPPPLAALGGYYIPPAIFADVPSDSPLAREEIFGPVLSVMQADTFEAALETAMGVDYALTGGVFSRSPIHLRMARDAFRVGNLYINRATTGARVGRQPFGGRRISGIGYQAGGPDYLVQFLETRVVTENTLRRGFASDEL
jgi:RHH-type transcriptional regulator, proline utilization regulon repressor / proline dehydrogenase / delta 1-pyrroline-5-carboxylate dehydrogenase